MAESIRILQPPPPLRPPKPPWILSSHLKPTPPRSILLAAGVQLHRKPCFISSRLVRFRPLTASSIDEASIQELESAPVAVELLPICSEDQFHRVIEEAQQGQEPVIVVWWKLIETAEWIMLVISGLEFVRSIASLIERLFRSRSGTLPG